jgi:hypothetical protein
MNASDVARQLEEIADAGDDFEWRSRQLREKWKNEPNSYEALEPMLRFMENHPDVDYGAPGPLVHFTEMLPRYEEKLIESVERQPTPDTVGMLNRAINGKRDPQERRGLLSVMERVLKNVRADAVTRERAFDYLVFQTPGAVWNVGDVPDRVPD